MYLFWAGFLPKCRFLKDGFIILTLIFCWTQILDTERLIYTDNVRSQEDFRLAISVEPRIDEVSDAEKPAVFVGVYNNNLNAACVRGDIIGQSIFNWDSSVEPQYWNSTYRICRITRTYGFNFKEASEMQLVEARRLAQNMPSWPANVSVLDTGEFTVVKLSEDKWPEELLGLDLTELSAEALTPKIVSDREIKACLDFVDIKNDVLRVQD